MEPLHRYLLRIHKDRLTRGMPAMLVLDRLVQKGFFTPDDRRSVYLQVRQQPDDESRARTLLNLLIHKGPTAFQALANALYECGQRQLGQFLVFSLEAHRLRELREAQPLAEEKSTEFTVVEQPDAKTALPLPSLEQAIAQPPGGHRDHEPPAVQKFRRELIGLYRHRSGSLSHFAHLGLPSQNVDEAFVNIRIARLTFDEAKKKARRLSKVTLKRKESLSSFASFTSNRDRQYLTLEDLLQGHDQSKEATSCLVYAPLGGSKTMICLKICNDWARGRAFKKYKLVIYISAREVRSLTDDGEVPTLLGLDSVGALLPEERQEVWSYFQAHAERVLIIFDSADEGSNSLCKLRAFKKLVCRGVLSHCSLLITSRPCEAAYELAVVGNIHQHVELLGFFEQDMEQLISNHKLTSVQKNHLQSALKSSYELQELVMNPLMATLLLQMVKEFDHVPQTQTELYRMIVHNLKRNYQKRVEGCHSASPNFKQVLKELYLFALESLLREEFLFSAEKVEEYCGSVVRECGFIMEFQTKSVVSDNKTHCQFIHLALQEYLAACAVAQSADPLASVKQCLDCLGLGTSTHLFWLFLAGEIPADNLCEFIQLLQSSVPSELFHMQSLHVLLLQCISEATAGHSEGSPALQAVVKVIIPQEELKLHNALITPYQCLAIGNALRASHVKTLRLRNCGIGAAHCAMLTSTAPLELLHVIDFNYNNRIAGGLRELVNSLKTSRRLKVFGVSRCGLRDDDGCALHDLLQSSHSLEELSCRGNHFGEEGMVAISKGLEASISLQRIFLHSNKGAFKSVLVVDSLCHALTVNKSLQKVVLSNCNLGDDSAAQIMKSANSLSMLDLGLNCLTDKIVETVIQIHSTSARAEARSASNQINLSESREGTHNQSCDDAHAAYPLPALHHNQPLNQHLRLAGNNISQPAMQRLAASMHRSSHRLTVYFGHHCVKSRSHEVIPVKFHKPYHSRPAVKQGVEPELRDEGIGDAGAKRLSSCVSSDCEIKSLKLWNNNISNDGASAIASALATNSKLTAIDLGGNHVTMVGVEALCNVLSMKNTTVRFLSLRDNLLFDRSSASANTLSRHHCVLSCLMTACHSILYLGLNGTGLDMAEIKIVANSMKKNRTLLFLKLNDNRVGDEGAALLSQALANNSTLQYISLCNTGIGDSGAADLAKVEEDKPSKTLVMFMENNPRISVQSLRDGMVDQSFTYHSPLEVLDLLERS